jgi:hypothetical protein
VPGGDLGLRDRAGADCGSGYIGKGDFRKFGLICFSGLLLIVMPWLRVV